MGTVQNIMGVLYSCTTFLGMFNMMSVMPILGYERSVMYRSAEAFPACPNTHLCHVRPGLSAICAGHTACTRTDLAFLG